MIFKGPFPPVIGDVGCGCQTCWSERHKDKLNGPLSTETLVFRSRMFLCQVCGNKRCPHATNHVYPCTGSNAPGQKGSAYE